jgi:hypothetical protein
MLRSIRLLAHRTRVLALGLGVALLGGCEAPVDPDEEGVMEDVAAASAGTAASAITVTREVVSGDVAHYTFVLRVGDTPSAEVVIHRVVREHAPWVPRIAASALLLLHGDWATFSSNFLSPGLGTSAAANHGISAFLAEKGIDVWGADRRWTRAPLDAADVSDFAGMDLAQAIDDTGLALGFARGVRVRTGSGPDRVALGGFSHGGQIAYEYAAAESQRPLAARHVKALVPIDIYAAVPAGNAGAIASACDSRDYEKAQVGKGLSAADNSFFALAATLDRTAPDDDSPIFSGSTNRGGLLGFVARTWVYYAPTKEYHLAGGLLSAGTVTALRHSPQARIDGWLAGAPAYQANPESADLDGIWCADGPRPIPDHLADIHVPIFYLGAAGGFGDAGLPTLALTGSSDVTTLVISVLPAAQHPEDYGHGDLLFADSAPELAWQPLAAWVQSH